MKADSGLTEPRCCSTASSGRSSSATRISDANPEAVGIRQNIANIGIFVLTQCAALQIKPEIDKLQPLIDINRNIAAGLSGRV